MITANRILLIVVICYVGVTLIWTRGDIGGLFVTKSTSKVVVLTDSSLNSKISKSFLRLNDDGPWLVLFQTERCTACKQAHFEMEQLLIDKNAATENIHDNIHLGAMDLMKNPTSRKRFGANTIPFVIYIDVKEGVFYKLQSDEVDRASLRQFLEEVKDEKEGDAVKSIYISKLSIPPTPSFQQYLWDFMDAIEVVKSAIRTAIGKGLFNLFYFIGIWFAFVCTVGGVMRCYLCFEGLLTVPNYLWNMVLPYYLTTGISNIENRNRGE